MESDTENVKVTTLLGVPDRKDEFNFNIISDGKIEMMHHRVMFGWRVRAGYVGDGWVEWDWCCGADHVLISLTYGLCKMLLEHGVQFKELHGYSKVKPWNKDEEFIRALDAKLSSIEPELKLIELLKGIGRYEPLVNDSE